MRDLYRELHNKGEAYPASHYTRETPRRYDHVFGSRQIVADEVYYWTTWLEDGLSDHAPVELEFQVALDSAAAAT